jgi:DNA-binding NarL/FixJ family response regulator
MVRMGLTEAVGSQPDLSVVGEASHGLEALEICRRQRPDVVLMDYQMPHLDGVDTARQLLAERPELRIILLSIREGVEDIWRAAQAGVHAYLPKSSSTREVVAAIRTVDGGSTYFPPSIAARLKERASRPDFTPREMDVLRLIVQGSCNKEIATGLDVSDSNVRLYVSRVLAKLGVADRTQAAVKAIRSGLVHLEN